MTPQALVAYSAAVFSAVLALFVLWRAPRAFANRVFAAGMLLLALQEILVGLSTEALLATEVLVWHRIRLMVAALPPGLWILFSLSYARANYRAFLIRWRWVIGVTFVLPLLLVTAFGQELLIRAVLDGASRWVLPLGWSGYALHLIFLLSAILVLVNLETTLRASTGSMRWRMKFMLLGIGALFAVQLYTVSQSLLYSSLATNQLLVSSSALIVADVLILISFVRTRLVPVSVYPSATFLYNSLTILIVGIYLLVVGALAKLVNALGGVEILPLTAFMFFLALLALAIALLSGEVQERLKRFVYRHLKRPKYDYRSLWTTFAQRTGSLVDSRALCSAIARLVSETFGTAAVTVWLCNETKDELSVGGSTALTVAQGEDYLAWVEGGRRLIEAMKGEEDPIDLLESGGRGMDERFLDGVEIRYVAPLIGGRELLGFFTLSNRVTKEPFSIEDYDLLKTMAHQAATGLLNLRLSDRLVGAKEMEAFQSLSAFFVHDLKNLASRLSLTLQNLPVHYDDPAFRKDLLKTISQSVENIDSMCSRLRPLSRELELEPVEIDLNELISSTLESLDSSLRAKLVHSLQPVPKLQADPEQIQKVLVNLVLNANEATGGEGEIRVSTEDRNGWVVFSVGDNGCGMSKEFKLRSLFKAFQTTKKNGLGIGLFHCKKIIEAHRGRIEVESQEGVGSTFRVLLPEKNP